MCIFEFSNISAKYNITYVIHLNFIYIYITYPSESLINMLLYDYIISVAQTMIPWMLYISMNFQFVGLFWDVFTVPVNHL